MGKETLYLRLGRMGWNETEKKAKGLSKRQNTKSKGRAVEEVSTC